MRGIHWVDVYGKEKSVWPTKETRLAGTGRYGLLCRVGINGLLEGGESGETQSVLRTSFSLLSTGILCGVLDRFVRPRKIAAHPGLQILLIELSQAMENPVPAPGKKT